MVLRCLPLAVALAFLVGGCGGSGGGGSSPPPTGPAPGPQNPCSAASLAEAMTAPPPQAPASKTQVIDGNPRWRVLDALWLHREARLRGVGRRARGLAGRGAADIGEIAVVEDEGDIIIPPNTYDLRGFGLRFTGNAGGGYDVRRIDGAFRTTLGTRLALEDDDSVQQNVPFSFSFYGRGHGVAFVNSDGNITFEEEDRASTERNVARLLTGPPRVAPFLADLDPTTGAGRVFAHAAADQYTITWCNVRGFDRTQTTSVQATLLPDGAIEVKYADTITLADAVVGLSPGRTGDFTPVNLSEEGPTPGGGAAIGERFAADRQLDLVALTRRFYESHPDGYDQLVIWSDAPLIDDAFAYETTVANEVRGIGLDIFDASADFGSGGRLRSLAVMDWLGKYPDDPAARVLGENSTLSVLGQEVGHRWLVFFNFLDRRTGRPSDLLLGRGAAHWSFFFDSDASVMEGNDIEALGGGSFRTVAAVERYSLLDQYAMGLVPASAVPTFFYVEPDSTTTADRDDSPRVGVTFTGTRRDLHINDILEIHGDRRPSSAESSREHRQAFVYIVSAGGAAAPSQVDKLDRIRRQWEAFFLRATDGRMRAVTTLR